MARQIRYPGLIVALAAFTGVWGCGSYPTPTTTATPTPLTTPRPDIGLPLYDKAPWPPINTTPLNEPEPLVIHGTVSFEERQIVASEVDGKIEMLASPWPEGLPLDPNDPALVYHPRDPKKEKPYRRLKEGDPVTYGQILCIMDDQLVHQKMAAATLIKSAAEEVRKSATAGVDLSEKKFKLTLSAYERGGIGYAELVNDQITLSRFQENLAQAKQAIAKAESDYNEALVMLAKHQVRSNVNGFIRSIFRRPGEFVKQGEKIMELQSTDTVRVEGTLDVQYAAMLERNGTPLFFEPALVNAPTLSRDWHRQSVMGVAVTAPRLDAQGQPIDPQQDRPLVVSVGADGAAVVWDVKGQLASHTLPHPVGVRCVAAVPAYAGNVAQAGLVVTGAEDGKVRLWRLSNPDALPSAPHAEGSETQASAINALAFSPDGRYFASAAGRDIVLWQTADARKLYALPMEHRDVVTSLAFTPQCTLISVSRDRSIKVWELGRESAAVLRSLDHRAGTMDALAVSHDGTRILFDQDRTRLDVVSLADGQTLAQIQDPGGSATFSTFALFSANDSLIATVGGEGDMKGAVHIWTTPEPGRRSSELARLIAPGRSTITCAAFSPHPTHRFLVVGTSTGGVHLWEPPQNLQPVSVTGSLTKIDATDTRYVTIRGEFPNTVLKLRDRSAGTIIIPARKK